MTPELRFNITAHNDSAAALREVAQQVNALAAQLRALSPVARPASTGLHAVEQGARLSGAQVAEMGHVVRSFAGTMLAGGSAMQAFGYEANRIVSIFTIGQGGLGGTFKALGGMAGNLLTKFWPLTAALAAVGLGFAGLTHELDKSTGKNITFMETVKAVFQSLGDGLHAVLDPLAARVGNVFGGLVDAIVPPLKTAGNAIIGTFVAAYQNIQLTWALLPAAIGDLTLQAANNVISGVHDMIARSAAQITGWISSLGPALSVFPGGSSLAMLGQSAAAWAANSKAPQLPNAFAGSAGLLADLSGSAFKTDYLGNAFGNIQSHALANYAADNAAKGTDKLTKAFHGLTDAEKAARQEFQFYQSTFSSFFTSIADDLRQGQSFWQSLADAAGNALSSIGNHLLELGANSVFNQLFGGGPGGGFGGIIGQLFGFGSTSVVPGAGALTNWAPSLFAGGTDFAPGGLAIVGEKGPELVNLPRGSAVTPAADTAALLSRRGGGSTLHFHIQGSAADAAAIARQIWQTYRTTQLAGDVRQINRHGRVTA